MQKFMHSQRNIEKIFKMYHFIDKSMFLRIQDI